MEDRLKTVLVRPLLESLKWNKSLIVYNQIELDFPKENEKSGFTESIILYLQWIPTLDHHNFWYLICIVMFLPNPELKILSYLEKPRVVTKLVNVVRKYYFGFLIITKYNKFDREIYF